MVYILIYMLIELCQSLTPILSSRGTRDLHKKLRNQNCQSLSSYLWRSLVPRDDKITVTIYKDLLFLENNFKFKIN